MRSTWVESLYFAIRLRSVWQSAHIRGEARRKRAVVGSAMSWTPWQSMQVGTSGLPVTRAAPWTLFWYLP